MSPRSRTARKCWTDIHGANYGLCGGVGATGTPHVPGKQLRADKMAEAGLYSDYFEKGLRRPGDPHLRVKDMDRDGVDAEVIYGILAACAKTKDPEAADEMLSIYNDFMHDFTSHYPDRMIGLACLPYNNIEGAAREVRRVAKKGMKGVELSCSWHMTRDVAPDAGIRSGRRSTRRSCRCISTPSRRPTPSCARRWSRTISRRMTYSGLVRFQMTLATILTDLMGAAVFERFPNIRMVLGESGIGWIPYVIDRMDFEYKDQYQDLKLKKLPSEYWREPVPRDLPVRPDRHQADRGHGRRDADVGFRLPASRRRVAGIGEVHRRPVQGSAEGRRLQDDLRERRQVLRSDELTRAAPRAACVDPAKAGIHRRTTADPAGNPRGVFSARNAADGSPIAFAARPPEAGDERELARNPVFEPWRETCAALHLYTQIVGKYRLARTPWVNHSWHATLYVNARGLTTGPVPDGPGAVEIAFDLLDHAVIGTASDGSRAAIPLGPMSVAEFHARFVEMIASLGGTPEFHGRPNEVPDPVPFREDRRPGPTMPTPSRASFRRLSRSCRSSSGSAPALSARSARYICSGAVSILP